ncbi:MAG: urease accessory protein UreE [Microcystaceae cyanobacterium]
MKLTITKRLLHPKKQNITPLLTLTLTAEERTRSRYVWERESQYKIKFRLPRGTILKDHDLLATEDGEIIKITAKPEPVFTIKSPNSLELLRVAYHLGNRHISLELNPTYLRLSPDPVLKNMINRFDVTMVEEIAPFQPEIGAYHSH